MQSYQEPFTRSDVERYIRTRNSFVAQRNRGISLKEWIESDSHKIVEPRFARILWNCLEFLDDDSKLSLIEKDKIRHLYGEIQTTVTFANYGIPRVRKIGKGIYKFYLSRRNKFIEHPQLEKYTDSQIILDLIGFWKLFMAVEEIPQDKLTYEEKFVLQYGWKPELISSYQAKISPVFIDFGDPKIYWRWNKKKQRFTDGSD